MRMSCCHGNSLTTTASEAGAVITLTLQIWKLKDREVGGSQRGGGGGGANLRQALPHHTPSPPAGTRPGRGVLGTPLCQPSGLQAPGAQGHWGTGEGPWSGVFLKFRWSGPAPNSRTSQPSVIIPRPNAR